MKVLTDGQAKEINRLLSDIKKSECKIEAVAIVETIQDVLLQAENVPLKVSC